MTKITHIITGLNVGGAERALHTLLTGGLQGPFENHVISLMDEGHYGPLLREAGIPVTCLNMRMGRPSPLDIFALWRAMRDAPADIVQGWMYHGNLAASLATRLNPKPARLAWNIRLSLEYFDEIKRSTRWAIRAGAAMSGRPDAIIYNSNRSRVQHETENYARRVGTVLPNGFDTEKWRPAASDRAHVRAELGIPEGGQLLGFVGRNHPQKDLPNLLRALGPVLSAFPHIHVALIGRDIGPQLGHVLTALPEDRIHILGERNDVPVQMRGFDFLCLSSRAEGFPNVIGEAMATGIPCVTTDVGDAAEIVGETGWVVPPQDDRALAAALIAAVKADPSFRMAAGADARVRIAERYSLGEVVRQYCVLYKTLAEAH